MRFSFVAAASTLVLSSLVGCASSSADDHTSQGGDSPDDALTATASASCSATAYNDGLAHYKKAVAAAKERAAKNICDEGPDGSSGMIYTISGESDAAVKSCAAFQKVIDTSIYAKPIRDSLAGNLVLPYLTGKLTAAGSWAGLSDALPGNTVWGPAPGAYGNMSKIVFAAGGKATVSKLNTEGEKAIWVDSAGTWSATAGAVTITVDGKATTYKVDLATDFGVVDFFFKNTADETDRFDSLPSECEA